MKNLLGNIFKKKFRKKNFMHKKIIYNTKTMFQRNKFFFKLDTNMLRSAFSVRVTSITVYVICMKWYGIIERAKRFVCEQKWAGICSLWVRLSVRPSRAVSRERLEILTSGLQHVVVLDGTSRPFFVFEISNFRVPKGGTLKFWKKKFRIENQNLSW